MTRQPQEFKPDMAWLYGHGWTIKTASCALGVNPGHLSRVIRGQRTSLRLLRRIGALPKQPLQLQSRSTTSTR